MPATPLEPSRTRIALGVSYNGRGYDGWQSQPSGRTVQDQLERALTRFSAQGAVNTLCGGRTDAGVHGLMQVVHFDTTLERPENAWVRGTNSFLPDDIAVQWAREVPPSFHARASARSRRYAYVLLESPVRPSADTGQVGWVFRPLALEPMAQAAQALLGEHDFSSFRSSMCQSPTPVKHLRDIQIRRCQVPGRTSAYWRFDFEGQAFLHHMIRNIMGCLIMVGTGVQPADWVRVVREARDRKVAAPTFSADGLYFMGPRYDPEWNLPEHVPAMDWLPV